MLTAPLRRAAGFLALALLLPLGGAAAQEVGYAEVTRGLSRELVIPRYAALAEAAQGLQGAVSDYCAAPSPEGLAESRAAFQETMDAWIAVQPVRFGPITYFERIHRLYFWPDKTNALSKQLAGALQEKDPDALHPENLSAGSVALQGLPALERLLFDGETEGPEGEKPHVATEPYACDLADAIADNVVAMSKGLLADWRDQERSYIYLIDEAEKGTELFGSAKEVADLYLRSLDEALILNDETRLALPLGASLEKGRGRLAESWRSQRSLENVRISLITVKDLVTGRPPEAPGFAALLEARGAPETAAKLKTALEEAIAAAEQVEPPLESAVEDADRRPAVETLRARVRAVHEILTTEVAPALDLSLGFNALDGD